MAYDVTSRFLYNLPLSKKNRTISSWYNSPLTGCSHLPFA
jgi:hypothetical protein